MREDPLKGRDIVLFGFQPWETQTGSNFIDMAHELAKHNRVLFVNRAPDRATLLRNGKEAGEAKHRRRRGKENETEQISTSLWVLHPALVLASINWIPVAWLHDQLNYHNNKRLAKRITQALDGLGFKNILLINDNDFTRGLYLKKLLGCQQDIFYLRDFMLGVPYFQRHGPRLEAKALEQSTMVAANSLYLANYARQWNPDSYDIGQGFSMDTGSEPAVPADMQNKPKPVIGYAGYLSTLRLDEEIIRAVAEAFPGGSVVLIGNQDKANPLKDILHLPNVYFAGPKILPELPAYIRCFDICINPQKINAITNGNYPRKVDEYLAMGKPVVVTKTEAMALFSDHTFQCTTKEEYIEVIRTITGDPDRYMSADASRKRIDFASGHTWTRSVAKLSNAYSIVQRKNQLMPQQKRELSRTQRSIRWLTICALIAYMIFIYIKFMFF